MREQVDYYDRRTGKLRPLKEIASDLLGLPMSQEQVDREMQDVVDRMVDRAEQIREDLP